MGVGFGCRCGWARACAGAGACERMPSRACVGTRCVYVSVRVWVCARAHSRAWAWRAGPSLPLLIRIEVRHSLALVARLALLGQVFGFGREREFGLQGRGRRDRVEPTARARVMMCGCDV